MNNNSQTASSNTNSNKKVIIQITSFVEFLLFSFLLSISSIIFQSFVYLAYVLLSIGIIFTTLLFIISFRSHARTDQFISLVLTFQAWTLFLVILYISGGIYSPFFLGYIFIIYISYILTNTQILLLNGILAILTSSILLVLQNNSIIKFSNYFQGEITISNSNIVQVYVFNIVFIIFFTILLRTIDRQNSTNINSLSDTIDDYLRNNNNLTNNLLLTNEKLEKVSNELTASEKYAELITDLLSPINVEQQWFMKLEETLEYLQSITNSIHCGIYLLDENKEWASLKISSNDFGKSLIKEDYKHHISSDNIIISTIHYNIIQKKRNIGLDSLSFQRNPFIESNYIIVFPIYYQGNMLGALELQNKLDNNILEFDEQYISKIATLYAILINNFDKSLAGNKNYNQQLSSRIDINNWIPVEQSNQNEGVLYQQGNIIKTNNIDTITKLHNSSSTALIPVKISNQTIATLKCVKKHGNEKWNKDELESLQKIANQLAIAITSSKLKNQIEKIQKQSNISSDISSELRKSVDIETLLQNAVKKIGSSFSANNVSIRLISESQEDNKENRN